MSRTRRMNFLVLLPPRVLLLDLAGPLEALRVANNVQDKIIFDVRYVAPVSVTDCSIGLQLSGATPLPETVPDDTLVFLPGAAKYGLLPWVSPTEDEATEKAIIVWLRRTIQPHHTVLMVCEGALLAAKAGLLAGYSCTTHHASCNSLSRIVPSAKVLADRLFVEDRTRLSSAGITAGIDLMLHLIARWCGPDIAAKVARTLVVYMRRGPNDPQLSPWLEGRNHLHPVVHKAQDAIMADPARDWSLEALGRLAGASARHLSRLFLTHTGESVTTSINRARLALVESLLVQTRLNMDQIAERAGFASARHMRRVWGQYYSYPPTDFRHTPHSLKPMQRGTKP